jgi:hypothetical protein
MFRGAAHGRSSIELTARFDEIKRIEKVAALVALISSCIFVVASRAFSLDIAVR